MIARLRYWFSDEARTDRANRALVEFLRRAARRRT